MTDPYTVLTDIKEHLRLLIPKADCPTVDFYAGDFTADEVGQGSFVAPAIFVACLGWKPCVDPAFKGGVDAADVRYMAFVTAKHAKSRTTRMQVASQLARAVNTAMSKKRLGCTGRARNFQVENQYSRKLDDQKLSLWTVTWWMAMDLPEEVDTSSLAVWQTVEIETTAATGTALVTAIPHPTEDA